MSGDESDLMEVAVLGRQIEDFLNSHIGLYLVQCADIEIEKGIELLKKVDAEHSGDVRAAQNQIAKGELFKQWLKEAVDAGIRSQFVLEQRQQGVED